MLEKNKKALALHDAADETEKFSCLVIIFPGKRSMHKHELPWT